MFNSETLLPVGFIFTAVLFLISLWTFFQSYRKSIKDEGKENDDHFVEINSSLSRVNESILKLNFKTDQICNTTNETRTDLKSMKNDLEDMREKQIRHDMEIKAIWKKLDDISGLNGN